MRIAVLIFATLALLASTGMGLLGAWRGMRDAKDLDALAAESKAALSAAAELTGDSEVQEANTLVASTGKLRIGAVLYGLAALAALALLVLTFLHKGVPYVALALVVLALVGTFLSPHYDLGPFGPASARQLGYILSVAAVIGAGAAFGAWALKNRRSAAARPLPAPAQA
jgi:hypothetical protein